MIKTGQYLVEAKLSAFAWFHCLLCYHTVVNIRALLAWSAMISCICAVPVLSLHCLSGMSQCISRALQVSTNVYAPWKLWGNQVFLLSVRWIKTVACTNPLCTVINAPDILLTKTFSARFLQWAHQHPQTHSEGTRTIGTKWNANRGTERVAAKQKCISWGRLNISAVHFYFDSLKNMT